MENSLDREIENQRRRAIVNFNPSFLPVTRCEKTSSTLQAANAILRIVTDRVAEDAQDVAGVKAPCDERIGKDVAHLERRTFVIATKRRHTPCTIRSLTSIP